MVHFSEFLCTIEPMFYSCVLRLYFAILMHVSWTKMAIKVMYNYLLFSIIVLGSINHAGIS